jgi:hypothetical protein
MRDRRASSVPRRPGLCERGPGLEIGLNCYMDFGELDESLESRCERVCCFYRAEENRAGRKGRELGPPLRCRSCSEHSSLHRDRGRPARCHAASCGYPGRCSTSDDLFALGALHWDRGRPRPLPRRKLRLSRKVLNFRRTVRAGRSSLGPRAPSPAATPQAAVIPEGAQFSDDLFALGALHWDRGRPRPLPRRKLRLSRKVLNFRRSVRATRSLRARAPAVPVKTLNVKAQVIIKEQVRRSRGLLRGASIEYTARSAGRHLLYPLLN